MEVLFYFIFLLQVFDLVRITIVDLSCNIMLRSLNIQFHFLSEIERNLELFMETIFLQFCLQL